MNERSLTEEKEMDVPSNTVPARDFLSTDYCKVTELTIKTIDFRLKHLPLCEIRIISKIRVNMVVEIIRVIGYAEVG
jgi:hypothetical protein